MEGITIFTRQARANSVDPDQMPQNVTFDQGLHCLPLTYKFLDTTTWSNMLFRFSDNGK